MQNCCLPMSPVNSYVGTSLPFLPFMRWLACFSLKDCNNLLKQLGLELQSYNSSSFLLHTQNLLRGRSNSVIGTWRDYNIAILSSLITKDPNQIYFKHVPL